MEKKNNIVVKTSKQISKNSRPLREEEIKKEFKKYFIKLKRKLNLDPSLENILWLHLKSAGYAQSELFDKGIENFGYTVKGE